MKTLIFGAGYLGRRMAEAIEGAILSTADITDGAAVDATLREHAPDAVLNAAGKTGKPNVDWCETHQAETYRSNVLGPLLLAERCIDRGIYLLHLGSGCIFYGPSPDPGGWREEDHANPSAFYSRTKYAADLVLSRLPGVAVARLRMPIDDRPGDRNLITKLARYREVVDVENSVTVVEDLIHATRRLLELRAPGVFHVTNPGTMRHRDLLALYRELVDPGHTCTFISEQELVERRLAQKARSNCILASPRLADLGIMLRPIDVALRETMLRYAAHLRGLTDPLPPSRWASSRGLCRVPSCHGDQAAPAGATRTFRRDPSRDGLLSPERRGLEGRQGVEPRLPRGRRFFRLPQARPQPLLLRECAQPHGVQEPPTHGGGDRPDDRLHAPRRLERRGHPDHRRNRVHPDGGQGVPRAGQGQGYHTPGAGPAGERPCRLREGRALLQRQAPQGPSRP